MENGEKSAPVAVQGGKRLPPLKKASSFVFFLLGCLMRPALYLLYRFRFDRKTSKNIRRPCLILANHQTGFDQFALSNGFKFGINYVATDSIFRHGFLSWLMIALVRPIPFSKGSSDLTALKSMMAVIKSGGSVGMFPSGNRSFYGDECKTVPGIGRLAKKFNVPLVLVRMHGGFNTKARWHRKSSPGKMTAFVSRVISRQELEAMSVADVDSAIQKELVFDEFEWNKTAQIKYSGRHKAEYLESVLFYCPECKSINGKKGLRSEGNDFFCRDCGARVRINSTGFFEKIGNALNIPDTILEWSRLQLDFVKAFDFSPFAGNPVFSDPDIVLLRVGKTKEVPLGKGCLEFFADRFTVCGQDFRLTEITMAVQGVRKLTVYRKDEVYTLSAPYRTNLMKYMICGYHIKNRILGIQEEYYGY
jgi:1-acyl-sn-glycerol-3-phosphate acyltransferase